MRLAVPLTLAVAALLAAALVIAVGAAGDSGADVERPTGPGLRLADRAGLVTVGMTARADGLELTLIAPDIDADAPEIADVRIERAGRAGMSLQTESCGDGCVVAPVRLAEGRITARVRVAYAGRTDVARLRFAWPLPPDAAGVLEAAVARATDVPRWRIRERVTSDPTRGVFDNPVRTATGELLAGTWAPSGALDPRELPAPAGWRRIAYLLPAAPWWFEVWIGPDGRIARDRIVGPKHLLTRTFTPDPEA